MTVQSKGMMVLQAALVVALTTGGVSAQETLVQKLLRIAGLTAAPSQLRGSGDESEPGDIWIANLDLRRTQALTTDGGYQSPVFSQNGMVYALKGGAIVRIALAGGGGTVVQRAAGVSKFVGFNRDAGDELIVLLEPALAGSPLGIVSLKGGTITPLPFDAKSEAERRMVAQVRAQDRVYGETTIYTRSEVKRGLSRNIEWTDVYVKQGSATPVNVSRCDGVDCVQPALSPDGRAVVFVRTEG